MSPRDAPPHYVALFDEPRRLGFIEGHAAGYGLPPERMEVHAADLMSGPVDAVVAAGDPAVRAAQRATTSIPILAFTDEYGRPRICELRASLAILPEHRFPSRPSNFAVHRQIV